MAKKNIPSQKSSSADGERPPLAKQAAARARLASAARARAVEPDDASSETYAVASSSDLQSQLLQALSEVDTELTTARLELARLRGSNERLAKQLVALSARRMESEDLRMRDELTGMANRPLLESRMQQAIVAASARQSQLAVLMIGLDNFETLSSSLGPAGGDHLLMAVASRIAASVRLEDLACRYDEAEFVVLLTNVGTSQRAETIVQNIRERIGRRYCIGGIDVQPTASIGLSFFPASGGHSAALLKRASAARKADQDSHLVRH